LEETYLDREKISLIGILRLVAVRFDDLGEESSFWGVWKWPFRSSPSTLVSTISWTNFTIPRLPVDSEGQY
jgi:hypothetical protein